MMRRRSMGDQRMATELYVGAKRQMRPRRNGTHHVGQIRIQDPHSHTANVREKGLYSETYTITVDSRYDYACTGHGTHLPEVQGDAYAMMNKAR